MAKPKSSASKPVESVEDVQTPAEAQAPVETAPTVEEAPKVEAAPKAKKPSLLRSKKALEEAREKAQAKVDGIANDLSQVDMDGVPDPPVKLPDRSLPSKDTGQPEEVVLPPSAGVRRANRFGLKVTNEDVCHHLSNWKGGVCVKKANTACPFLQGNQKNCEDFVDRRTVDNSISARRAALRNR